MALYYLTPLWPSPARFVAAKTRTRTSSIRGFTKYPLNAPSSTTWTVKYLYRRPDIYGYVYDYDAKYLYP